MSAVTVKEDIVRYVAIAFGYWGRGETELEALANCRKAGAKKSEKTIVYQNVRPGEKEGKEFDPTVDSYGNINYYGTNTRLYALVRGKKIVTE